MGARSEEDRRPKCSGKSPAWLPVVEPMPVLKPCYLWALDPRCSTCRLCDLSQVTLPWRFSLASIRWDNTKKTCFTGLWWGKARVVYTEHPARGLAHRCMPIWIHTKKDRERLQGFWVLPKWPKLCFNYPKRGSWYREGYFPEHKKITLSLSWRYLGQTWEGNSWKLVLSN